MGSGVLLGSKILQGQTFSSSSYFAVMTGIIVGGVTGNVALRIIGSMFIGSVVLIAVGATIYSGAMLIFYPDLHHLSIVAPVDGRPRYDFLVDSISIFAATLVILGALGLVAAALNALINRAMRKFSDALIIHELVGLLQDVSKRASTFNDIATKSRICRRLQRVAAYLQTGIPGAISLPNPAAQQALQDRFDQSVAYLNEMQLAVTLANDKTLDEFRNTVVNYIWVMAQGRYELLPVGSLVVVKRSKKQQLVRVGKTIAVAIIPISCLLVAQLAGAKPPAQFTGWAIVASIAWAAITFISLLDPAYKSRLDDVRDFVGIFRGKSN